MPDSTLKRVSAGQPLRIRAATWNTLLDAAEDYQRRQLAHKGARLAELRSSAILPVANDSGADQDRFAVLGLNGPVITPEDNQGEFDAHFAFSGVAPAEGTHEGLYAILLDALPAGAIGRAVFAGVARVAVCVSDADHQFAEISDGQTGYLVSAATGSAQILWAEPGTGIVDALVRLAGPPAAIPVGLIQLSGVGTGGTSPCQLKRIGDEAFAEDGTAGPYTAVPEGQGPIGTGDVFMALEWPDGSWHFPAQFHRLTGT